MDNCHSDRVLAFDSLFTTNHIQMLKLLVGYMDASIQGKLAVYIKFQELFYTLKLITEHPTISLAPFSEENSNPIPSLLDNILPFCTPEEKNKIQNLRNMFQSMENMKEMMQMIELLQEISPELFTGDNQGTDSFDFSQMMGMFQGADLSQMNDMMNMMQGMFASDCKTDNT